MCMLQRMPYVVLRWMCSCSCCVRLAERLVFALQLTSASSLVTEAFTLEAHTTLQQEGLDISGADWVNKVTPPPPSSLTSVPGHVGAMYGTDSFDVPACTSLGLSSAKAWKAFQQNAKKMKEHGRHGSWL